MKNQSSKTKENKIYKNKKLNKANFSELTHNDYQVFLYLISKIKKVNENGEYIKPCKIQREYTLTAKEFNEVFKTSMTNCYKILKKATDKLMKIDVTIEMPDKKEMWRINICSMAKYNQTEGNISIEFTDRIMPYLTHVKQKFVLYNIKEIANFGSLYTTRLYELIQEFKDTGYFVKSIDQLRDIFAVNDKFGLYGHFKKNTFEHAYKEINHNYDIGLAFKEIKQGRKVVAVEFSFKKTEIEHRVDQQGNPKNVYIKPLPKAKSQIKYSIKDDTRLQEDIEKAVIQLPQIEQNTSIQPELQSPKSIARTISNFLFGKGKS
jgi:plasmid replication initiation protein